METMQTKGRMVERSKTAASGAVLLWGRGFEFHSCQTLELMRRGTGRQGRVSSPVALPNSPEVAVPAPADCDTPGPRTGARRVCVCALGFWWAFFEFLVQF